MLDEYSQEKALDGPPRISLSVVNCHPQFDESNVLFSLSF